MSTAAVERLLLITLALEGSLRDEDFAESSALFDERAQIIDALNELVLTPKAKISIDRVQEVEKRILALLTDWRTSMMREFDDRRTARRANHAYLAAVGGAAFSMDVSH